MADYSGVDLLNVFSDLNIRLLNLSPNVIKAWFDTDDKNMKDLLTWMCTSVSNKNYVSPLENQEFLELETPLVDQKYERELTKIEVEYPGIFDIESNANEIEFIEDEIELLLEEERHIDELINLNETLQNNMSKELANETSKEIQTSIKLKATQELCNTLGEQLDELNGKLHTQLMKYGSNLYNFEFGSVPNFINNLDINECQQNFENVASFLMPLLETQEVPVVNFTYTECQTSLDSLNLNQSVANSLNTMRHRILHSHQNYLVSRFEVDRLKEILAYLNNTNLDTILSLTESVYTQMNREAKEETKKRMCGMLDNISTKLADHHIAQTKLKYAQQELELHQAKLNNFQKVENIIQKFLSQYFILSILYIQEKKDIDTSDAFFRKILNYIIRDLQNCATRMEKMKQIINEYEDYTSKTLGERYKIIRSIIKILSDGEDFNLSRALEVVSEFKNELNMVENKMLSSDFNQHRKITEDLRDNIKTLQKFLVCGPTRRIVLVPSELHHVLREVKKHLDKQITSVNSAVEIASATKKIPNKWQNYRRQLWMYFYTDPQKLTSILQQIEEEFKKHKLNGIQMF